MVFLRDLGSQFRTFVNVRLAMTPLLSFRDLVSQAKDHELRVATNFFKQPSPSVAFVAGRGRGRSSGHHNGRGRVNSDPHNSYSSYSTQPHGRDNYINQSNRDYTTHNARRPYIPRC